jgi:hypothetical protein
MDPKTTTWHTPEFTTLVRSGEARSLDMIYGGQPGKEGTDHCHPKK